MLRSLERRLSDAFSGSDRLAAHAKAGVILAEMASDPQVLHQIVLRSALAPDFLTRLRINPVIAIKVAEDRNFTLIAHLWIPLDDGRTDLTHQSVHHHGSLLLTSVSAWGGGYESVLFKPGFKVDAQSGQADMTVDKIYHNPRGHLEFIGPRTPHVVLFPKTFTVTYALWSSEKPHSLSLLRKLPGVQAYKARIKAGLKKLGLASGLGLNVVENLDFYPDNGRLLQMKERVAYATGTADNYLQNFFWALQQMKHPAVGELKARFIASDSQPSQASRWLSMLEQGEQIPRKMEQRHLGIKRVQFTKAELLACFASEAV